MALIEIDNLTVTFRSKGREVRAVEGVSLSVDAHESYGLVGESGSGKSTILRAICGMAPVTGGSICIGGKPVPVPRGRAFSTEVQMVFQDPYASLHPRHTIDRTLSEPLAIHGLPGRDARVVQALTDVGLQLNQLKDDTEQRDAELRHTDPVAAFARGGEPQVAVRVVEQRIRKIAAAQLGHGGAR